MMQGDLIRHYGEHMVTAKVGAAPCGPALPERARRLGCFLPRRGGRRRRGQLASGREGRSPALRVSGPAWDGQAQLLLGGAWDPVVPSLCLK